MARITDINRIKRLKESTMKLVVDNGFGGASAAMIAVNAKVSAGYFYMHYKGKYELVNSLLQEVFSEAVGKIEEFLESEHSFSSIVNLIIEYIFHLANEDPVKMKFLYVLSNDYNFVIDPNIRNEVYGFLKRLKELGQETHALDEKITEADLYMLLLVSPIQYINMRFKFFLSKESLTPEDQKHMLYIIQKVLIKNR
ncbi:MAG TPA: TetR family transcriptional regulator [Prolixibacteraceae bacterium]|nr:TetR family transcriptional regulator [Prolixibacteraceae bacterium]